MLFNKANKTVDSILSTFADMVKQLTEVSDQCASNIEDNAEKVSDILKDTEAQKAEKDKADVAIAKLNNFITQ